VAFTVPSRRGQEDSVDVPALIRSRLADLSPNDRRIAAWLLEHLLEASFETADSLARKAGVSKAAVVRFGRKLGFGGYAGLHEAIARGTLELLSPAQAAPAPAANHVVDAWLRAGRDDLEATRRSIDQREIDAVVELLDADEGRTYVFGQRTSGALAEYAFFLLNPFLANVQPIELGPMTLADSLLGVAPEDRLLALTFRRHAKATLDVVEFFATRGASVVLLTDDAGSPAAGRAQHRLLCQRGTDGPFSSGLSALYVLETIAAGVAGRVQARGSGPLDAAEELWDRFGP
jgi:DNA-binding MurR/RpiR family transcriptional regulator